MEELKSLNENGFCIAKGNEKCIITLQSNIKCKYKGLGNTCNFIKKGESNDKQI